MEELPVIQPQSPAMVTFGRAVVDLTNGYIAASTARWNPYPWIPPYSLEWLLNGANKLRMPGRTEWRRYGFVR